MMATFSRHAGAITAVIHAAAQPSHDWAARDPGTDFGMNPVGTLAMLEAARRHAPTSPFVFTSTNKVYGDRPNALPLVEGDTRWEIDSARTYKPIYHRVMRTQARGPGHGTHATISSATWIAGCIARRRDARGKRTIVPLSARSLNPR